MIVAIAILVGVMLAASKIFNTTSQVSRVGEATNNVMQDIAAGERQLRADLASLSRDGFFAIRCVAVPNSIYANTLLDPNRPPDAMIRCDQLVFFTTESAGSAAYTHVDGNNWIGGLHRGRGLSNRIYYGHGFSLGTQGEPYNNPNVFDSAQPIFPWSADSFRLRPVDMSGTRLDVDRRRPDPAPTSRSAGESLVVRAAAADARQRRTRQREHVVPEPLSGRSAHRSVDLL